MGHQTRLIWKKIVVIVWHVVISVLHGFFIVGKYFIQQLASTILMVSYMFEPSEHSYHEVKLVTLLCYQMKMFCSSFFNFTGPPLTTFGSGWEREL